MFGIQLYIETETIKRPFSPNWFEVYSDLALQFILLSIEKERHKIVADYLQRFLRRISLFRFLTSVLQTQKVYTSAFY